MTTAVAPRVRVHHVCSSCGAGTPRWEGRCPACGDWNTLTEQVAQPGPRRSAGAVPAALLTLDSLSRDATSRAASGLGEVDRVLGGGLVAGSLVLLGGDPGIGKSTLALDLAHRLGTATRPALYCAGEESPSQLSLRAVRTGCAGAQVGVLAETDLDAVVGAIDRHRPPLAVVDSVQTLVDAALPAAPGSVTQVREAVARLLTCAKSTGVPIVLVGHVTKEGAIAGPRTLEHMVDVVLYLEGERHGDHRLLRGVKNRFGATDELGILVLGDEGIREAAAPGRAFLDEGSLGIPGTALAITCDGARPLAVEVQALVAESPFAVPRRTASGFDLGRLHLLLAILERRAGFQFGRKDVYVNVVGGVRLADPAADLAVALAIAGAAGNRPLPEGCAVVGELGLGGEVRRVRRMERRLNEAAALGLQAVVVPAGSPAAPGGVRTLPAPNLRAGLAFLA